MNTPNGTDHPLAGVEVSHIQNFTHWMNIWESHMNFDSRTGLLEGLEHERYWHFDYGFLGSRDTLIFLLGVAHGYKSRRSFGDDQPSFLRALLARRAFDVLRKKFFSLVVSDVGSDRAKILAALFGKDGVGVCKKMASFFSFTQGEAPDDPLHVDGSGNESIEDKLLVKKFLLVVFSAAWDSEFQGESTALMRAYSIRVFNYYGVLFQSLAGKELDEVCEAVLRQITFGSELELLSATGEVESRFPKTIGEAVFGGSEAAYLLSLWGIHQDARLSMTGNLVLSG